MDGLHAACITASAADRLTSVESRLSCTLSSCDCDASSAGRVYPSRLEISGSACGKAERAVLTNCHVTRSFCNRGVLTPAQPSLLHMHVCASGLSVHVLPFTHGATTDSR